MIYSATNIYLPSSAHLLWSRRFGFRMRGVAFSFSWSSSELSLVRFADPETMAIVVKAALSADMAGICYQSETPQLFVHVQLSIDVPSSWTKREHFFCRRYCFANNTPVLLIMIFVTEFVQWTSITPVYT